MSQPSSERIGAALRAARVSAKKSQEEAAEAQRDADSSLVQSYSVPPNEPLAQHIDKLPVDVQVWYHTFMSELLKLSSRDDISAATVQRAREQITFAQLDLWAGGELGTPDVRRTLHALRWCAEATWRNVTDPGWLERPRDSWEKLPSVLERD